MSDESSSVDTSASASPVDSGASGNSIAADIQAAFAQMSQDDGEAGPLQDDPPADSSSDDPEPTETPEPSEPEEGAPEPEEQPSDQPRSAALKAPDHWSQDDKDAFAKATPDLQRWALKRDKQTTSDYTRKTQELAEQRKRFEALDNVLAEARTTFNGVPDHEAVRWMANVHQFLRAEPQNAIKWLRQTYNIHDEGSPPAVPTDESDADPVVSALKRELSDVKAQVSQFTRETQADKQARIASTIDMFREQKGPDGQPMHPHFDAVQSTMAKLVRAGIASDLKEAYEKAVALDPTVSALEREAQAKRNKAAEQKKRAAELEKAKKAGFRVAPSPQATQVQPTNSIADELRAVAGGRKVIF